MALLVAGAGGCPSPRTGTRPREAIRAAPTPPGETPGVTRAAAPIRFDDVTEAAGIRFRHTNGADGRYYMPEIIGSGCALFDYDADGFLDLFLVNGSTWPNAKGAAAPTSALFHNEGNGSFRDVTRGAGLAVPMHGMGCAVGDIDNDGRDDLLVTSLGQNRLFRNLGAGKFQDITRGSGLETMERWRFHTSAAFLDFDGDARLDLFVCRYLAWSPETDVECRSGTGKPSYCPPATYPAERCSLYRGLGRGKFRDVSAVTGVAKVDGRALGVLPFDQDGDGWTDVFVANDQTPNFLFANQSGIRFEERAQESGVAVADNGIARAGMGVDAADYRNSGGLALAVGNFSGEGIALFQRGQALYTDAAGAAGLVPASLSRLTFGLGFLDADRDGWQDLFAYNGHVDPTVADRGAPVTFRQLPQLFRNGNGAFTDVTSGAGPAFRTPQLGRGCSVGDWDNDGRPDLLLMENGGPAHLLRNVTADRGHWLGVVLRGTRGNRNGYGAEVRLSAGGVTQRRWVRSGGSYLSHSDTRALFGLGGIARVDRVEVRWPSGNVSTVEGPGIDRYIEIREPRSEPG